MIEEGVRELIESQDMNALLRVVDSYCEGRRWDDLVELADLCEEAVERGKQLWPIAAHVDYRIALEGPPALAAEMIESELGRFTLGPLSEVAASTHDWSSLAPHIASPHTAAYVAQERVLRGEDLTEDERAFQDVLELPLRLEPWEPTYALAQYRSNVVEVAEPWEPKSSWDTVEGARAEILDEPEMAAALIDLVHPWTTESNGAARAIVVEGDAAAAATTLSFGRVRMASMTPAEALQRMAWAAASGGAYGKRRGAAFGRMLSWHTAALLADVPWPPSSEELGRELARLRWFLWDEGEPEEGWILRIAVEDPANGWSAALAASDVESKDPES